MYVYINIYMYTCIYIYVYTYINICTHPRTHAPTHTHTRTHIHTSYHNGQERDGSSCQRAGLHHVFVYVYVSVCVLYTHIHTSCRNSSRSRRFVVSAYRMFRNMCVCACLCVCVCHTYTFTHHLPQICKNATVHLVSAHRVPPCVRVRVCVSYMKHIFPHLLPQFFKNATVRLVSIQGIPPINVEGLVFTNELLHQHFDLCMCRVPHSNAT